MTTRKSLSTVFVQTAVLAMAALGGLEFAALGANWASGQDPGDARSAEPPALSPVESLKKESYAQSQRAQSIDDFSALIEMCEEGLKAGAASADAAYFRKMQAWAHNKRGEKYAEMGDEQHALQEFESAVALDSSNWRALHNRGVSKGALGDLAGAMADFDKAIQMYPNYANAWYNRAELKYEEGDFPGAIRDYTRAIQLNPRDGAFYNSRGHAYYRLGRHREALSNYSQAIRRNPNDAAALVNRGDAYRDQGIFGPAATDYREAIRINPKLGRAYLSAAWMMATCPDPRYRNAEQGVPYAKKAIELDGNRDYRYLDTLAAAEANAGNFDEAVSLAKKAVEAAPEQAAGRIRARLELYENDRAYRDGGPAEAVTSAR